RTNYSMPLTRWLTPTSTLFPYTTLFRSNGTDPARIVAGDNWLESNLDAYKQWAQTHNSLLIVTWDEAVAPDGNHIPTIFVGPMRSEEHTSELQSRVDLVCRLLLEKKKMI